MKWLLVALVMNQPVKTDLVFESLSECMQAERLMRKEWAELFNETISQPDFRKLSPAEQKTSREFMLKQANSGTCIPAK